ncbi:MAG: metallophosphoesterase family protein [Anaerolineae bacterium]|nr:metallophosphoesterase family protein [Anaerolineae bacterium]
MKIGILSDTHNHRRNTEIALAALRERGVERLIHCGDLTTPDMVYLFAGWPVTFVRGNMDMARADLEVAARQIGALPPALSREIEIGGAWIGVTHGHDSSLLYKMMISGKYAYLCCGHTHRRQDELRRPYSVRLINPGALGGSRPQTRSVAVLDVATGALEFIELPELS